MKWIIIFLAVSSIVACGDIEQPTCRAGVHCGEEAQCIAGECESEAPDEPDEPDVQAPDHPIETPEVDMGVVLQPGDPIPTTEPDLGPVDEHRCNPATSASLVINEILASVPTDGDANGDGVRDAYDDEFIELVNTSDESIELNGVRIWVGDTFKFKFEPLCLGPKQGIVVFGGGSPNLPGDVHVITTERRFGLTNSGNTVTISDDAGIAFQTVEYGDAKTSWQLWPELYGSSLVPHGDVADLPFTPGRCSNGMAFGTGCSDQSSN